MNIIKAITILKPGESAVVVFTRGVDFKKNTDGNGTSGNWVLDPADLNHVTKIIVYERNDIGGMNWVFSGKLEKVTPSPEPRRYILHYTDLRQVGTTNSTWLIFGNGERYPVCIIKAP